jgi:DNA primase
MNLIDEVKSRTDIVQVIAESVDLETSSRTPKARCPFHNERTPSFYVFPETGTWRCFGACATGGDVVSFVMKRDNLQFKEALRYLADRAGIRVEQQDTAQAPAAPKATVIEANEAAAKWFGQMLLSSTGAAAREYLASRGISTDTAARRGIGFAPGDGMLTLAGHLRSSHVDSAAAKEGKLVTQGEDRTWRDFFRNRVTIEIHDRAGKVIGFGARSMDGSEPKYLNTPQTSVFDKSSVLYGLDWAAESIRQSHRAVVVEGYMDAITAHEHGFTNVVASMGTAVTPEQLQTLLRLVSGGDAAGEVVLCLDSDAAGQDATLRALETAWHEFGPSTGSGRGPGIATGAGKGNVQVMVAPPVGGKDPDEAIRADSWAWRRSLDEASPLIDFIMRAYGAKFDTGTGDGKARVVEAIAPLIFAVSNDYDRDLYWTQLAEQLAVPSERLMSMAPRPGSRASRGASRRSTGTEKISTEQLGAALAGGQANGLEEHLLALVLQDDNLREFAEAVPREHFLDTANRELFTAWRDFPKLDATPDVLNTELAAKEARLRAVALPPSDHSKRVSEVTLCVRRLSERYMRHVVQLTELALQDQEPSLADEEREQLRNEILDPSSQLKKVFEAGFHRTGVTYATQAND